MKKQLIIESNSEVYIEIDNSTDVPIQFFCDSLMKRENKKSIFIDACFEYCKIKISTKYIDVIKITDFSTAVISSKDALISQNLKVIVEDSASLILTKSVFNKISTYSADSAALKFDKTLINILDVVNEDHADVNFIDSFFYNATVSSSDGADSYFKNTFVNSINIKTEDLSNVNDVLFLSDIKLDIDDLSECSYSYIDTIRKKNEMFSTQDDYHNLDVNYNVNVPILGKADLEVNDKINIPSFGKATLSDIFKIIEDKDNSNNINYMIKSILEKDFPTDHINPENRRFICEYIEKHYSLLIEKLEQKEIDNMNKLIVLFNINTGLNNNIQF